MSLEVNGINLRQLRNDEYIQFLTDISEIVQSNNPTTLNIKLYHDAFIAKKAEVEQVFAIQQGSELTDDIVDADNRRDNAITGIGKVIDGYTRHFQADMVQAAKGLQADLAKYQSPDGIAHESLSSETAIISSIAADWSNLPALSGYVTKLNLGTWLDELKTANDALHALYLNRTQEEAAKPAETMKAKRLEMNTAYYLLREKLVANASVNNFITPWSKTINECNESIAQYVQLIATHPKKSS